MNELRGFITFLDGCIEDDDGNVTFTHAEILDLEKKILNIVEGRIEFVQRYNAYYQTVIFLGDLRKRATDPLIAVKKLRDLLVPMEARMEGLLKVHLLCSYEEGDRTLLLRIGDPDQPLE